mmetsp:Transcript_31632/g.66534  ORF Transcript_31632/g.66534 Transcript_31632/m.66534 type:complete len:175 (+) Transcript_31632:193-717(+)
MLPPSATLLVVTAMAIKSCAFSFSIQPSLCVRSFVPRIASHNVRFKNQASPESRSAHYTSHRLNLAERDTAEDDEDDGWGDEKVETSISPAESSASAQPSDRISKSQELARLQNDMATKRTSNSVKSSGTNDGGERDMFIPIVTLVSVIGFTGLYGYEMLRLYSRGELYLPWEN